MEKQKQANEQKAQERKELLEFERAQHEQQLYFATEKAKLLSPQTTYLQSQEIGVQAKLPKMEIPKFDGESADWLRFWSQFQENVDKRNMAAVSKLGYLQSYLTPKVRALVSGLPYNEGGYNEAKTILENKYGRPADLVKHYIKEINELSNPGRDVRKIHDFADKLSVAVHGLKTLNKLNETRGLAQTTLDKLSGIRNNLIGSAEDFEEWGYEELLHALNKWMRKNPVDSRQETPKWPKSEQRAPRKAFTTRQPGQEWRLCVYCEDSSHKSVDCTSVCGSEARRKTLIDKKLCFNCTRPNCRVSICKSKVRCRLCSDGKHHTSICPNKETLANPKTNALAVNGVNEGILPIVVLCLNGVRCRALVDSGSGSSYASRTILNMIQAKPFKSEYKTIEMMLTSKRVRLDKYKAIVENIEGTYELPVELTRVDKATLLDIDNPQYRELQNKYRHLQGIRLNDYDVKSTLPVHVILGSGDYARIKTSAQPIIGNDGEPIAEKTRLGWFIMSPGIVADPPAIMFAQTSQHDYEELCRLDVLGISDSSENDQQPVYTEFKEQLYRDQKGWYETALPWKGNHPPLPNNCANSLRRLQTLERNLHKTKLFDAYNEIIKEQREQGIIELAPEQPGEREFYLPHRAVVRETAITTKLRIVYDGSARAHPDAPSLNQCLHQGPALQNELWGILVHQRVFPIALVADIRKAFLQIRVREADRDALRFHWKENGEVITYRFARVLFGLTCSPFLLNGVLNTHLDAWSKTHPVEAEELRNSLYIDDIVTGGTTVSEVTAKQQAAIQILNDATFDLHKWASNVRELDVLDQSSEPTTTNCKSQIGTLASESKILGLGWNKSTDTLSVNLNQPSEKYTKRELLSRLAQIYDPLGLAGPLIVVGKQLYREACDSKTAWDAILPPNLQRKFRVWEKSLPATVTVSRSLVTYCEPIEAAFLHSFGDASQHFVAACVYAVLKQPSGVTQRMVAARTRLAKRGLSIPRLELVASHMAINLLSNVHRCLQNDLPTDTQLCAWSDSTVVLWWLKGTDTFRQFVSNRVHKIQAVKNVIWRYVPTNLNPADLGSRGGPVTPEWTDGPPWLSDPEHWPQNIVVQSSPAAREESKSIREVLKTTKIKDPVPTTIGERLLAKYSLRKTLRILALVCRFIDCVLKRDKTLGPLQFQELQVAENLLVRNAQRSVNPAEHPELNLKLNNTILTCHGRVQGEYPLFLPRDSLLAERVTQRAHMLTLHGGVASTMAKVREYYWIPKLRSLVKQVRRTCHGCRRYQIHPYPSPNQAQLPTCRTTEREPYSVVGIDYAGPLRYRTASKTEGKAYLLIFACALTRGVHLELLHSQETEEFIRCFKHFMARRGRPQIIYSDNGLTFKAAANWIEKVRREERVNETLANHKISWRFNLAKAPWWGGQYERLIGVFKNTFRRIVGKGLLTFDQLAEVVIDIEMTMNDRPLTYLEDDVELPVLTPNSFLPGGARVPADLEPHQVNPDLRHEIKRVKAAKHAVWQRWRREYLAALREIHKGQNTNQTHVPEIGELVIVEEENPNRNCWKLAKIVAPLQSRDGKVRGVKLQTSKGQIERPVQAIYPLELRAPVTTKEKCAVKPNSTQPRPVRSAAVRAKKAINNIANFEQSEI